MPIFGSHLNKHLTTPEWYYQYSLSTENLQLFAELVELCKHNNIDLKVFISPSHVTEYELLNSAGLWNEYEKWKRELVKVHPLWDFSGYNTITTEKINDDMRNFWDSIHYRKEVGNLILTRILGNNSNSSPDDFGYLLSSNNIEFYLIKTRADREMWAKNNADIIDMINTLPGLK